MLPPKKSLGQHFLIDGNVRDKIVGLLRAEPGDVIVEIGPGTGAMTGMLHSRFRNFVALEIDQRAVQLLREQMPDLDVRHCDVVGYDWEGLASEMQRKLHVIGNLPYYVTSQVIFGLLEAPGSISEAVMMMQREVAERLVASPRTKAYGILSVMVQLYSEPELAFRVSRNVFRPRPDVESAVVRLAFDGRPTAFDGLKPDWIRKVVKAAFNQRRKTLRNSLRKLASECRRDIPEPWGSQRAEELSPEEFVELARYLVG